METTTQKRTYRPRMQQRATSGTVVVNENRKQRVIGTLLLYGRLPTRYLVALYGSPWVVRILERLYHQAQKLPAGKQILRRPREINRPVGYDMYHELAAGAFPHTNYEETYIHRTKIGPDRLSDHDAHLCMIVASIQAALQSAFISHLDILRYPKCPPAQREAEAPISMVTSRGGIEPDALFGHEVDKQLGAQGYKFYAVELDRGTESYQTKIQSKIDKYEEVFEKKLYASTFGIPNMRVLWFVHCHARKRGIQKRITRHQDAHLFVVVPKFNLLDRVPDPDLSLYAGVWETAAGEQVQLIQGVRR